MHKPSFTKGTTGDGRINKLSADPKIGMAPGVAFGAGALPHAPAILLGPDVA